jgi:hypothetical protein
MTRVIVNLNESEWRALREQSERELRPVRDQARYIIIRSLAADLVAAAEAMPSKSAQLPGQGGNDALQA